MAFFLAMIPDHTIYCIKSEIQKHTHIETQSFYVIRLFKKLTLPKKNFISYFLVPEKHWRKIQQDYNDINYSSLSIFQTNVSFCPILNRILFYFENNHITHINKNGKGHPIWPKKKNEKKFSLLPGTKKMKEIPSIKMFMTDNNLKRMVMHRALINFSWIIIIIIIIVSLSLEYDGIIKSIKCVKKKKVKWRAKKKKWILRKAEHHRNHHQVIE